MKKQQQGTLTEGSILKVLTKLALPIMASSFLSTAYSITDMAWIGGLGAKAVAGVGAGGMYGWLSQGLSSMARMGGQVYVAQYMGQGERDEARKFAQAAMQIVLFFGILFGAVCILFADPLVRFFGMNDPLTVGYAQIYLQITCGLILFSYINYTLTGLFTAQGDSATPLKANSIGLVINMVFDPLLIMGIGPFPRMEVVGAAVATVAAQIVVTVVLVAEIVRRGARTQNILREMRMGELLEKSYYTKVLKMGFPTGVQSSVYCLISMVLTRMVAVFGDAGVATQRVGGQIESVTWNIADGFAAAMNAFVGQNYGARKMERVKKGYWISCIAMMLWGGLITFVFVVFPEPIARIFFHEEPVIEVMIGYLLVVGLSEAFMCVELMAMGAISGMGSTKICSLIGAVLTALRIPVALLLTRTSLGLHGVWWALTVTSMLKGIVLHMTFLHVCRGKTLFFSKDGV